MSGAERIGPSLRSSGAKLGFAKEISAAIPAHCNKSVSVTRTTAALASRTKIIGSRHRGQGCFVHELVGERYSDPNGPRPQACGSGYSLFLPASTKISVNADPTYHLLQFTPTAPHLSIH